MVTILAYICILGFVRAFIKSNRLFILVASLGLFLLAALRTPDFGNDTFRYVQNYNNYSNTDFSIYLNNFLHYETKDPGFHLFSKILSMSGMNGQGWLATLSIMFILPFSIFVKNHSINPYLSYVALISLGYFFFTLTGLRQSIALGIVLLSYEHLLKNNSLTFVGYILVASIFHSSALIFLLAYPFSYLKFSKLKYVVGAVVALLISMLFGEFIRILVNTVGWTENLKEYANREVTLNYTGFIIQFLIMIFVLNKEKKLNFNFKKNNSYGLMLNLLFLGIIFQSFSTVIAEFFRVSMYFSIFSVALIPNSINIEKYSKNASLVYFLILIFLLIYIYISGSYSGFRLVFFS